MLNKKLLRRIDFEKIEEELSGDFYNIDYEDAYEFVSDFCDYLVNDLIENHEDIKVLPKEKDSLYHYFYDLYSKRLYSIYNENKNNNLKEDIIRHINFFKKLC